MARARNSPISTPERMTLARKIKDRATVYRGSITEAEAEALEAMNARITLLQTETRAISARMRDAETEAVEQVKASRDRWETEIVEMVERLTALDMTAAQN